jgi:hypothetical protein
LIKGLHIITLNVPYPPDYGGMVDSFYRLHELSRLGIDIHLHCFYYGRNRSDKIGALCSSVNYYKRHTGLFSFLSSEPYIVHSRRSSSLIRNLNRDEYPILFDGLHTTHYLRHPSLRTRKKYIRMHNVEHSYYRSLCRIEKKFLKKAYLMIESARLKRYEKIISLADGVFAISVPDQIYCRKLNTKSYMMPAFHAFTKSAALPGYGDYILYHGDLSVSTNAEMASIIAEKVFSRLNIRCIVAGKDPPLSLSKIIGRLSNAELISNPGHEEMLLLVQNAHINILPVLENNGFKLKLLHALFAGRYCIINKTASAGNNLSEFCIVADSVDQIPELATEIMKHEFNPEMIISRKRMLMEIFDNEKNAIKIVELISGDLCNHSY